MPRIRTFNCFRLYVYRYIVLLILNDFQILNFFVRKKVVQVDRIEGWERQFGQCPKEQLFFLRRTSLGPNKEFSIKKNCTAPPSWSRLSPRARVGQLLQCKCRVWAGAAATQDSSANLNISRMWRNSRVAKSNIEKTQEQWSEKGRCFIYCHVARKKANNIVSFFKTTCRWREIIQKMEETLYLAKMSNNNSQRIWSVAR